MSVSNLLLELVNKQMEHITKIIDAGFHELLSQGDCVIVKTRG